MCRFKHERVRVLPILIFVIVLALSLRIYMITNSLDQIDSDEAIGGLMALHVLEGERPFLYYDQSYQGTLDVYIASILFWIFGSSDLVLRMFPLFLSIVFVGTTYLLGTKLYSPQIGVLSALYVAISPFMLTRWSLYANAHYILVLITGNISLLLYLSVLDRPSKLKIMG